MPDARQVRPWLVAAFMGAYPVSATPTPAAEVAADREESAAAGLGCPPVLAGNLVDLEWPGADGEEGCAYLHPVGQWEGGQCVAPNLGGYGKVGEADCPTNGGVKPLGEVARLPHDCGQALAVVVKSQHGKRRGAR